jgi:hypothetical protein
MRPTTNRTNPTIRLLSMTVLPIVFVKFLMPVLKTATHTKAYQRDVVTGTTLSNRDELPDFEKIFVFDELLISVR